MKQKVIILHAWYNKPDSNWYPWLKKELEKRDYEVAIPELPTMNSDSPDLELLIRQVKNLIDIETTLIGHSLTCLLAMRLAERIKFKRMILVAGWDFDDLTREHKSFWSNKLNHEAIKGNVAERYVIHADNDPYFTAYQAEEMAKRLDGKFILVKGAGHFTQKNGTDKIPQILKLI